MSQGGARASVDKPVPSLLVKLSAALYYAGASMLVQFINKALFTTYKFDFPITVALLQMAVIAPVCYTVARPKLEWEVAKGVGPLAVVNVLNVLCGLVGTGGLNVPMFIALRRFTLLCTIVLERLVYKKLHERSTVGAVLVMVGGGVLAAATDLSFNLLGYSAVLINDFLTALYLIMVKSTGATAGLTTTGLLFYNAALSLPLLTAGVLIADEPRRILLQYPLLHSRHFQLVLGLSCVVGLTINHSTFVCTRINEPLATSVAGSAKNVFMTLLGAAVFPDFRWQPVNVVGLVASMAGAIWYATWSALKQVKRRQAKEALLSRDPSKQPLIGRDRLAALAGRTAAAGAAANGTGRTGQLVGPAGTKLELPSAAHRRSDSV